MSEQITQLSGIQHAAAAAANFALPVKENPLNDSETELIRGFPLQCKLTVGSPDDPLEHEADAAADKVMRMPEQNFVQRKCAECEEEEEELQRKSETSFIQRKCRDCEKEDELQLKPLASSVTTFVQAKNSGNKIAGESISSHIDSTKGGGNSMDSRTKSFMENRFGKDFSGVKIHTGNYAAQMSQQLNAQAFTVNNDIYFNSGKYDPSSYTGKHLLAHELTHTIQQGSGMVQNKLIQREFSPWPGQTGTDVPGTYSSSAITGIISERVQRTGDPNFSAPMPSLLTFDPANRVLTSTMEINFIPETSAANTLSTDAFNALKAKILRVGNDRLNGWITIRAGSENACLPSFRGQEITVRIAAAEGTGPNADTVMLGRNYDRENSGHIGESSTDWTIWHEMGHIVLGAADEYAEAGRPSERVIQSDYSIMASSGNYGRLGMLHSRHFSHLAAWLGRKYPGCTFTTVESNRPVVIDWTPNLFLGGFGGRNSGLYYSLGVDMGIPLDRLRRLEVILGPRFNFIMDISQDHGATYALLAGLRAGLRYRSGSHYAFTGSLFGEGGGVGFTDLAAGTFGTAPYVEGGGSLGLALPFGTFSVEGAGGGRTTRILADPSLRIPESTEFRPYYRVGLTLSATW